MSEQNKTSVGWLIGISALLAMALPQLLWLPAQATQFGGVMFISVFFLMLGLLAWPLLWVSAVLGRRSALQSAAGIATLTREADAKVFWRFGAWLFLASTVSVGALVLMTGLNDVLQITEWTPKVAPKFMGLAAALIVVTVLAQFLSRQWLIKLVLIVLVSVLIAWLLCAYMAWPIAAQVYESKPLTLLSWQQAAAQAVVAVSAGLGLLWGSYAQCAKSYSVVRVSSAQLLVVIAVTILGLLAASTEWAQLVSLFNFMQNPTSVPMDGGPDWDVWHLVFLVSKVLLYIVMLLVILVFLAQSGIEKGQSKRNSLIIFAITMMVFALLIGLQAPKAAIMILKQMTLTFMILASLWFTIFVGWAMKISHVRKELALPSETLYLVFRVWLRIVMPLALLWALKGVWS
jgi:SNF family Na+-dependent transporter